MDMLKSVSMGEELNFNPGKELIENLENIRVKKNKTKTQFAEELGISPSYYTRLIKGELNPTIQAIENFSKKLKVDYSSLLLSATSLEMIEQNKQASFQLIKDSFAEIHKLEQENRELKKQLKQHLDKKYEMTT